MHCRRVEEVAVITRRTKQSQQDIPTKFADELWAMVPHTESGNMPLKM
jgi:hypothetical protein